MLDLEKSRAAIQESGFSGWLLTNMFHRDEIADLILDVPRSKTNTRPWFCILFPDRPPLKLVHRIEDSILSHVPGDTIPYSARAELESALSGAIPRGGKLAADYSPTIPVGSYLDHGTALLLLSVGATLAPADVLIARYLGTLDAEGMRTHEAAAAALYRAVEAAWSEVKRAFGTRRAITEGDVQQVILDVVSSAGFEAEPPIVGAGRHSNDSHFSVDGRGAVFAPGDTIQLDLWCRAKTPGAVYGDISWVGVCADSPSELQRRMFDAVRDAREAVVSLLQQRLSRREAVTGADADRAARTVLTEQGFGRAIRHRTGHSIGARVHGYGVNLDSVEFPDERPLVEGSCFSVEPAVYLEEMGMRTEIDCIIHDGALHISGTGRQTRLLTLAD